MEQEVKGGDGDDGAEEVLLSTPPRPLKAASHLLPSPDRGRATTPRVNSIVTFLLQSLPPVYETVGRGSAFELPVPVSEAFSVVVWEFATTEGEVRRSTASHGARSMRLPTPSRALGCV